MPLHPLLRPFASATLLRPLLRPFFSYSEGRRGVADAKGRSRRSTSRRGPLRASSKKSIFRGLEDGAVPRLGPGSSLRSSPGSVRGSGRRGRGATMENGVLGGSFRPAPDCDFTRIAESCGTRRAHPGCPRERSSQSAKNRSPPGGRAARPAAGPAAGVVGGGEGRRGSGGPPVGGHRPTRTTIAGAPLGSAHGCTTSHRSRRRRAGRA